MQRANVIKLDLFSNTMQETQPVQCNILYASEENENSTEGEGENEWLSW